MAIARKLDILLDFERLDLLGDPTVESANGEPDEQDKHKGSEQGDSKGARQMSAKFVVVAAHLTPLHVFVAF